MQTTPETVTAAPSTTTPESSAPSLTFTAKAVEQVKEIIRAQNFEGYYLSVRVVPAGCSGLGYDLNLVKEPQAGDTTWEVDGIKVATDGMSLSYLAGTEMDYSSNLQGAGFKFSNPNAKSSCGCGSSFTT